ncbi:MAG TPA: hypothetical protein VN618_12990 [Solirubrobacteraceae bacterium]|nr:hypothetical protein [Solirubrobacteraceae bacterium]
MPDLACLAFQGQWRFGWTALAAIGTLVLAVVTALLAWSTRKLADASTADQQAQWRPVLSVNPDGKVDYDEPNNLLAFTVRNVGRGPAFGTNAQVRSGTRSLGSSIPGLGAPALAPEEAFYLQCNINDSRQPKRGIRGIVVDVEVTYYDVTEYWHKTFVRIAGFRPPRSIGDLSVQPTLRIASVFFEQTENRLLPVTGSPRAREQARAAEQFWWKRQWARVWRRVPRDG